MVGTNQKGKMLDPKQTYIDPIMTFPFVVGMRERMAGEPKQKGRWLTSAQQVYWEEGWDFMDEFLFHSEEPPEERGD